MKFHFCCVATTVSAAFSLGAYMAVTIITAPAEVTHCFTVFHHLASMPCLVSISIQQPSVDASGFCMD